MKKTLLLVTFVFLLGNFVHAQVKIWDFGNDSTTWPATPGIGTSPVVVDNLGLFPIETNTNFGAVNSNNQTFPDGFSASQRFQMNGAGYPNGPFQAMPTQRFLFMGVSGSCTVKLWFRPGSNGAVRTMFVTNGSTLIGSQASNTPPYTDSTILEVAYTGGPTTLYVYGDSACNLYKLEVNGATVNTTLGLLSVDGFEVAGGANAYAVGKQVYLNNIELDTQVNVYSINGALVRTFNTNTDMSFDMFQTGLYVVTLSNDKGQKNVKLVIQ
jgi:hypothetical protein